MTDMMNVPNRSNVSALSSPFETVELPPAPPRAPAPAPSAPLDIVYEAVGRVVSISGSGAIVEIDAQRLKELGHDADPSVAMSGQVGSQIKIEANRRWLLANIRSLRLAGDGTVIAETDFLGEGDEDPQTGKLANFKRGVTGYPIPGARGFPVTRSDLKQIYAADERAHVEIGTVYPTKDIRAPCWSTVFSASISLCWAPPAPANRPRPLSSCTRSAT